ncbi:MAG: RIP metalloprotease RseP [Bryobacteraceae bacterium]
MSFLAPVFCVVILLGVMIIVHELGHYWAAIACGVKVETFSIGFGPRLFGFRRGETDFRVSAILFGGYVRMLGEMPVDTTPESSEANPPAAQPLDPRSLQAKPRWQRAIVIAAGPFMNIVLAVAIVTGLYMYAFPKQVQTVNPPVTAIAPGSPAAKAGVEPGDKIVEIGGKKNPTWDDIFMKEAFSANHPLPVVVERHGHDLKLTVLPRVDPQEGIGVVGWSGEQDVRISEVEPHSPAAQAGLRPGDLLTAVNRKPIESSATVQQAVIHSQGKPIEFTFMRGGKAKSVSVTPVPNNSKQLPWHIGIGYKLKMEIVRLDFPQAFVQSVRFNQENATMIFKVLGSLIERRVSSKVMTGPIGIAQMSSQAAQEGAWTCLFMLAVVSLNLAIFNLLHIPILDGGTLLMLIVEMLLHREVSMQAKEAIFKLGFVFLMMIVVFVIYNDISRILTQG